MSLEPSPQPHTPGQRPFILDPLFRRLTDLPGIGPKLATLLGKLLGGERVVDLLWHRPIDVIDRRFAPKIKDAPDGMVATLTVTVHKHFPPHTRIQPYKVWCTDETGAINLIFFHAHEAYMEKQFPVGGTVIVSGRIEYYNGQPQMPHPDLVGREEDRGRIETIEPIYPLTAGILNKTITKALRAVLEKLPALPEWQDAAWLRVRQWPGWQDAVQSLHFSHSDLSEKREADKPPQRALTEDASTSPHSDRDDSSLTPANPSRQRLAYDELLASQLALALIRAANKRKPGRKLEGHGELRKKLLAALPFKLTGAQDRSLGEIYADMAAPARMLRLLQGDVGSGKTVVAALAMLNAVECGCQAALMAPTEILARQHGLTLAPLLKAAGVRGVVLTGRDKGKAREAILADIAIGHAQVVIGTHALFQESIAFRNLAVAVIDEQHKFGVAQRLQLAAKGNGTDVLVMTATPIPRTLALTNYGDMDVSRLDEKPPGRSTIDTRLIPDGKLDAMVDGIGRQLQTGARVYWVCPLVEESEVIDLNAAQERFEMLQAHFGDCVGLVHGRLKPEEKDATMQRFAAGELTVLVATTVIEVGVNVPEATIMVVEHAERFGLAQLHQLRGRVGRGAAKSYCFLVYSSMSETARERLTTLRETEDGFVIAEKDFALRGAGDLLGTRQSGDAVTRLADLPAHTELLEAAHDDARLILDKDPQLQSERGQALRVLLYLFERDQAIQYLRAG